MAASSPEITLDAPAPGRAAFALIAALLLVAFACGGGGSNYALANLSVQLAALALLACCGASSLRFWRDSPLALRILIAASLALPLLQLVPLPQAWWSMLPGRDLVAGSLELLGEKGWRPHSLDPLRTLLALTALITPLAVLMAGWTLPRARLLDLGWLLAALGLVTVLMGVVQLGSATDAATLYGTRNPGAFVLGTFANRNSTGLFLTFALGLVLLLPAPRPHPAVLPLRLALGALLLLAVVLTQSRTAVVLALLPLAVGGARALGSTWNSRKELSRASTLVIGIAAMGLVAVGAGTLAMAPPDRLAATFERFEARDDPRRYIWEDAAFTAGRYWPAGAGMGTFDEIYQVDESLENLTERRAGRAHNDILELAIEAGLPGLALAAAWLVLIGWLSWRARIGSGRWAAWAGGAFLLAIALQSITDYPLRNQTILACAGFALLLLVRLGNSAAKEQP